MKRRPLSHTRVVVNDAFSRAAGADLVAGNHVRILKDACENYPAWLAAIESAERTIHFESYIIHEDEQGWRFAELLAKKAREGVTVRLVYDWVGAKGAASHKLWRTMREAGVEVRCFNPPRLDSPFGWLSRDHRKMLTVDRRVGFVTGLCVGSRWVGDPARGIEPWRDTGVEVLGPAVTDIELAFADVWEATGAPIPAAELEALLAAVIPPAGEMNVRVVDSKPNVAGLYRLDQLIAAVAKKTLWLTDAYFLGTTPYVQALMAAARDGVDVRLLVPRASDILFMRSLARAGFRPLLEAGVRVYEWNGPMLHAKTAVADGRWARVGSSNLNLASWISNWELDVVVEDKLFGEAMEAMYLDDLNHATEVLLSERHRLFLANHRSLLRGRRRIGEGSATRAAAGAMRISNVVGAAITNHRLLGPAEARVMTSFGLLLAGLSIVAFFWPRVVAYPIAFVGLWIALSLLYRAAQLHFEDHGKRSEAVDETAGLPVTEEEQPPLSRNG